MKVKRLISIFVVVALLASFAVVPVYADFGSDLRDGKLMDLLDYGNAEESVTNHQKFWGSASFNYNLPSADSFTYVDVLIRSWSTNNPLETVNLLRHGVYEMELTLEKVATNLYRAYGRFSRAFSSVGIEVIAANADVACYATVVSFKIGAFGRVATRLSGVADIYVNGANNRIQHTTSSAGFFSWDVSGDNEETDFSLDLFVSELWSKYDFIDFSFVCMVADITSINVLQNGEAIPFEVSYIDSTSMPSSAFYVTVRVDLRSVDRTYASDPVIQVWGNSHFTSINAITIVDILAHVNFEYENPIIYWFKKTFSSVSDGFSNVVSGLTSGFNSVVNAITGNSSNAEQAGEDMKDAADDLTNMGAAFDQVETPDIDAAALTGNFTNFSPSGLTVLASITNNSYVTSLLALVFTFALCAYIFFGRKR